ncbi:MAG: DinB family protein [Leptospiraceae bacterium]|nr:DinB family protein [Leptospiraceae bacterium]MCK6382363.1 DinB family protein [Leptospiraceae bacterium]NUM40703.1 DinB family protein [Leptospiraceae bacterium]
MSQEGSLILKTASEYKTPNEVFEFWKQVREEVITCFKKTPQENFTENPTPDKWSVSEIAEHLYLSQFNLARMIPVVMSRKFGNDMDEQPNLQYEKIRDGFLKPSGIKNPDTVNPLNKYPLNEVLKLLQKSEEKIGSSIKNFSKSDLQKRGFEHPILGPLNLFNWFWVMSLHEYSHLVALKEKIKNYPSV